MDRKQKKANNKKSKEKNNSLKKIAAEADLCAVCLYPKRDPVPLPCNHTYCRSCLNQYYQARSWQAERCPLCRCSLKRQPKSFLTRSNWRLITILIMACIVLSYGPFYYLLDHW